jgi:hypothetical protein
MSRIRITTRVELLIEFPRGLDLRQNKKESRQEIQSSLSGGASLPRASCEVSTNARLLRDRIWRSAYPSASLARRSALSFAVRLRRAMADGVADPRGTGRPCRRAFSLTGRLRQRAPVVRRLALGACATGAAVFWRRLAGSAVCGCDRFGFSLTHRITSMRWVRAGRELHLLLGSLNS